MALAPLTAEAQGFRRAFFAPLGTLSSPGGGTISVANGVSFDGSYVAGYSHDVNGQQAVVWKVTPTDPFMVGTGSSVQTFTLQPVQQSSPAEAKGITVTPTGTYVAGSNTINGTQQAVRW